MVARPVCVRPINTAPNQSVASTTDGAGRTIYHVSRERIDPAQIRPLVKVDNIRSGSRIGRGRVGEE